jgi:hypothetical protein
MKNLVINTQYMENYGDRLDPYMKFKGGNTFILPNCGDLDENEIATLVARVRPFICTSFEESNGGCEEYINDFGVVERSEINIPAWETVTEFHFLNEDGSPSFMKVTDNREDGWMKKEILERTETWTGDMSTDSKRKDYYQEYLMEDGDIVDHKGMIEWFELNAPVESEITREIVF